MTEQSSTTLYYWLNKFDLTCWNRTTGEVQNLVKDHLAVLTTVHFICRSTLDFNLKLSMNAYPAATAWEKTHGMQETWRKTDYWQQAHSIVGFHFPNTSCLICSRIFSWDTFQFSKKSHVFLVKIWTSFVVALFSPGWYSNVFSKHHDFHLILGLMVKGHY